MKTKWFAILLIAGGSLFAAGCAGRYGGRFSGPRFGPGYSRYPSGISASHQLGGHERGQHRLNQHRNRHWRR